MRYLFWTGVELSLRYLVTAFSTLLFRAQAALLGCRCGQGLEVVGLVGLWSPSGGVEIGNRVTLVSSSWRCASAALGHGVRLRTIRPGARILIESNVGMNGTSVTCRSTLVRIGEGTMIAPEVSIVDSDFHAPWPAEDRQSSPGLENDLAVDIGCNVWIGTRCLILKGATIGDHSIIAAGSVVTGAIPANALAAGNPARVIKLYAGPEGEAPGEAPEEVPGETRENAQA